MTESGRLLQFKSVSRSPCKISALHASRSAEDLVIRPGISTFALLENRLAQIPIFKTGHLQLGAVSDGVANVIATYDPAYGSVFTSYHEGLLTTLANTASWVAVLTLAGADAVITTSDINIRFLAPCHSAATAEAIVIKFGKTLCPVSVQITDAQGISVATAQVTYMRLTHL